MTYSSQTADFYQVPDLQFDIKLLKSELENSQKSKYHTLGITNFAAIPMNRILG